MLLDTNSNNKEKNSLSWNSLLSKQDCEASRQDNQQEVAAYRVALPSNLFTSETLIWFEDRVFVKFGEFLHAILKFYHSV
jgi:hypothetical protein